MKGQYLAVESVTTLGMGLIVAIGTITAFSNYKGGLMNQAEEYQLDIVEAKVTNAVYSIKEADSGETRVELPETVAGQDYELVFDRGLRIFINNREYTTGFQELSETYNFQGTVTGGSVKIFKRGNQYILRAD